MLEVLEQTKRMLFLAILLVVYWGLTKGVAGQALANGLGSVWGNANEKIVIEAITNDGGKARLIDQYLMKKGSPMVGQGINFVEQGKIFQVDPYLMVAMAGAESGFGNLGYATDGTYNAVGLGIHEGRRYGSWEEGIEDLARVLRWYYLDEGRETTLAIQNKWAPRGVDGNGWKNSWAENVDYFRNELQNEENKISQG